MFLFWDYFIRAIRSKTGSMVSKNLERLFEKFINLLNNIYLSVTKTRRCYYYSRQILIEEKGPQYSKLSPLAERMKHSTFSFRRAVLVCFLNRDGCVCALLARQVASLGGKAKAFHLPHLVSIQMS